MAADGIRVDFKACKRSLAVASSMPISFANCQQSSSSSRAHHELLMRIPYTADAALPRSCSCTRQHTPWLASLHHPTIIQHAHSYKAN